MKSKLNTSDVQYRIIDSPEKDLYKVYVTFIYNNNQYTYYIFVDKKGGKSECLKQAKKIFADDLRSGKVDKYIKYVNKGKRCIDPIPILAASGAVILALSGVLMWKFLHVDPVPSAYHWVYFDTLGGSHIDPMQIKNNECIDRSTVKVPVKNGYTFLTWYIDDQLTTTYDFTTPVTEPIVLYAKYTEEDVIAELSIDVKKDEIISFDCDDEDVYVDWGDKTYTVGETSHKYNQDYSFIATIKGDANSFGYTSNKNSLTSVTINKVKGINDNAFEKCKSLKEALITNNSPLTTVGKSAFAECSALENADFNAIPQLTTISDNAFANCGNLQRTAIPNSVKTIGSHAFAYCSKLSSPINISSNVTSVGESAFYNCSSLSSITIDPNSQIKEFGRAAFDGCNNIETINLPKDLEKIDNGAFEGCAKLKNISLANLNSLKTIGVTAFKDCTSLTSVEIPKSVTSIGDEAFCGCTSISNLTFDVLGELTSIGNGAFKNCSNISSSVAIPYKVTVIGNSAFEGCSKLKTVEFMDPNPNYDSLLTSIGNSAFKDSGLKDRIFLPSLLKTIGSSAFENCKDILSIHFVGNDCLVSLGDAVFKNCERLNAITGISGTLDFIGKEAFTGTEITGAYFDDEGGCYYLDSDYAVLWRVGTLTETGTCTISSTCKIIYDGAFENCKDLTSIVIPKTVKSISGNAFKGCTALTSITIPDDSELETIDNSAFEGCDSLASDFVIPDSVTKIGENAFYNCKKLKLKNKSTTQLKTIGSGAFYNCATMTSFTLSSDLTEINDRILYGCEKLEGTLTIGNNVTRIGTEAFAWCRQVTDIVLDKNNSKLEEIGEKAFNSCSKCTFASFDIPHTVRKIGKLAFCLTGLSKQLTIPSNILMIPDNLFGFSKLESFNLPKHITRIGNNAFNECRDLASFTFEEGSRLDRIGEYAFYGTKMSYFKLPTSVTQIDMGAFHSMRSLSVFDLTDFRVPNKIPTLGLTAFVQSDGARIYVYNETMKDAFLNNSNWNTWANKFTTDPVPSLPSSLS